MASSVVNSDTPFSKGRANSHHTHSLGTPEEGRGNLPQYRAQIADDMAHAAVLAETDSFCDTYFPNPSNPSPNKPKPILGNNPFAKIAKLKKFKGNEAEICKEFVGAVNEHNLIPGLVLRVCGQRPDGLHVDPTRQKVDAAWYLERDAPSNGKPEWGDQVIPVEFKGDEVGDDPFDDEKPNISTQTKSRKKARGQMITYSELLHAIQQRTALFMLIIIGRRARFSRWDRSGTVVTRAFNYVDNWRFFCDILWRIGHCSATQLGFDPTATRLSMADPDWHRMHAAAARAGCVAHSERVLEDEEIPADGFEFEYVRDMFKHSLVSGWPWYRVEVPIDIPKDEQKPDDDKKPGDDDEKPDDKKPGDDKKPDNDKKPDDDNQPGDDDEKPDDKKPDVDKEIRHFLIGKPTFRAKGMAGRGTRGYVALDCATERFVWLKDAWRANYEFVEKEGDILAILNSAQVSNVPTMLCHGDMEGQTTETPDWWERKKKQGTSSSTSDADTMRSSMTYVNASSSTGMKRKLDDDDDDDDEASTEPATETEGCPLRLHQHYRLVVQEVAMPLDHFELPQQLVQVMLDCVVAHYEAYTKPKAPLLHRDISSGNILIYPRVRVDESGAVLHWEGILADWEMSKPVHTGDGPRKPRQPERTGTWQYTSVALLSPGNKLITLADELESFLHVFLYYALRYIKSLNCDGQAIANFLESYFDVYGFEDGMYTCGALKTATIKRGKIDVGSRTLRFGNPLDALFKKVMSWFMARYLVLDYAKESAAEATPTAKALPEPVSGLRRRFKGINSNIVAQFGAMDSVPQPKEGPTKEEVDRAKVLENHKGLVLALDEALCETWPDEKAGDQIPAGWKPSKEFQHPPSRNVENKRKRLNEAKEYLSEPLQLLVAPRPPQTPQRRTAQSLNVPDEDESP